MRSLIRYGLQAAGFADTFRNAVVMLFNMSILPYAAQCELAVSHLSCLNCCGALTISAAVTMPAFAEVAAAAAAES